MSKKILVVGDLHAGSESAIAPFEYRINEHSEDREYTITANKIQEKLYSKWNEMCDEVGKVDGLFLLGDLCDGQNYKGRGIGITHSDIGWQVDLAYDLIKEIDVARGNYYGVQGSAYHVENGNGLDWSVLKRLTQGAHSKFVFGDEVIQDIEDIKIHARHVTSYSKVPELRKNALKRDILEYLNEGQSMGKVDLALRGHTHYYEHIDYKPYLFGAICPCWKGRDTFIAQKSVVSPDCGYLMVEINNGDFEVIPNLFKV